MGEQGPSVVHQIVGRALGELRDYHDKVTRVHDRAKSEVETANSVIKALEKALGRKPALPASSTSRPASSGTGSPRARFTERVIDFVRDESRSIASIANHFGSTERYVSEVVNTAVQRGQLHLDGHVVSAPRRTEP